MSSFTPLLDRRQALGLAAAAGFYSAGLGRALAAPVAKLGTREVHVVSDGAFPLPLSMVAKDQPAETVIAALKADGLPTDDIRNVMNVTLIRDGADWTLIDCGSGDTFLPGSGKLLDNLEAAGVDRAAVKQVIFTHAHPDHLWGAVDSFGDEAFPNATFQISEAEWAFWTAADVMTKVAADRQMFATGAQRVLKAIAEKTRRFKPGQEVAPGIVAVDSAGHTAGHVCFVVSGGSTSLVVLGDALTNAAVSFRHPDWRTGSDADGDAGAATRKKLLDWLAKDRLPFIGYHLPSPGLGRAEAREGAYRYIAAG